MALYVARFTKHAAPSEFNQQGTGWFNERHPVGHVPHGDGGNSGFLGHPLNQTNCLMALGSDRYQQKNVDAVGLDPRDKFRNCFGHQCHHIIDIAETVVCIH